MGDNKSESAPEQYPDPVQTAPKAATVASPSAGHSPATTILRLQRRAGNRVVQHMLEVGAADDPYEREADQVADAVMRSLRSGTSRTYDEPAADPGSSRIQRNPVDRPAPDTLQGPNRIRRSAMGRASPVSRSVGQVRAASRIRRTSAAGPEGGRVDTDTEKAIRTASGGKPLSRVIRSKMEGAFGADFGSVRLHRNSELAPKLGARAFTAGSAIHLARGEGNDNTSDGQRLLSHELTHVVQQQGSVRRSSADFVQRLAYSDKPDSWNDGVTVSRSGEGVAGVFFVKDGSDTVVVKPLASVGNVEFANEVMEKGGVDFEAPKSLSYAKTSTEGQAISSLLLANTDKGRNAEEIPDQIAKANYFMVMSMVGGKSIQTLGDNEAREFLMNSGALQSVGRLMVADAFLGNGDRLLSAANLGNFFYVAAGTVNGKIVTIDNDSSFKKATINQRGKLTGELSNKIYLIEALLEPAQRLGWITQFLNKFAQVHGAHADAIQTLNDFRAIIEADISTGVDKGFVEMAGAFTTNIDLVHALGTTTDKDDASNTRDVDSAKGTAQYIKARMGGVDAKTAKTNLTKYMKYRAKRNRTVKGFKWITKLVNDTGFG